MSLDTLPADSLWTTATEPIYRERLSDAFGDRLEYYYERLDAYYFGSDSSYESEFADYLLRKYHDRPIDLLLVGGIDAAAFAAHLQARLAGNPPIVFQGKFDERPVPKSAGVNLEFSLKGSLDLALRIHPETRHVFLVSGTAPIDNWYDDLFHSQVPVAPQGVDFTDLRGLSVPALIERLAALPPRSVVLLLNLTSDSEGRPYRSASVLGRLAAASSAPLYSYNGGWVGIGAFGGRLLSAERAAEETTRIALRVLRGARPEDIPLTTVANTDALDWRQLARWGVREADVPPGVELMFRAPSVFQQYRRLILSALALLFLQTALIAALLIQRRNKRLAERSLKESEERFRLMADTAPVMIWRSGSDQQFDFFNKPWLDFRGRSLSDEIGKSWTEGVHPEDVDRCLAVYAAACGSRQPFRMEYRLRRADGEFRWMLDSGVPRTAPDGTFLGYIGSCLDITERRRDEQALLANEAALRQSHAEIQDLAGRLITAQEEERARIARDLHDDVSQQLASISIAISACKRRRELDRNPDVLGMLSAVQRQTIELNDGIRLLSHELHPGVLKHAGLVDALRSHCTEFARQHSLDLEVDADDDSAISDIAVALCLYRVVQEALRNIAKHAHARHVLVTVRRVDDEVQLAVTDDGHGFDLAMVREQGRGLGLRSIDERVRLVGGRLSVETAPGKGTAIVVWVQALAAREPEFATA
jgi:PAS domain S-box-containing protein